MGMIFELMHTFAFMGRTGGMWARSSKLCLDHSQLQTPEAEERRGRRGDSRDGV